MFTAPLPTVVGNDYRAPDGEWLFPVPARMTFERASDFLADHFEDLAAQVDDHERRGRTHFFYLEDQSIVTVNRQQVLLHVPDGEEWITELLAEFTPA